MRQSSWLGGTFLSAQYALWVPALLSPLGYSCRVCATPSASAGLALVLWHKPQDQFICCSVICCLMLFLIDDNSEVRKHLLLLAAPWSSSWSSSTCNTCFGGHFPLKHCTGHMCLSRVVFSEALNPSEPSYCLCPSESLGAHVNVQEIKYSSSICPIKSPHCHFRRAGLPLV